MSSTIFWRKDEPDEFQVKDINIPGVFPRPPSKVDSLSVFAAAKPWLRPKKTGLPREPVAVLEDEKPVENKKEKNRSQGMTTTKKSRSDSDVKVAVSLKDLNSEDKRRVANLIKELAKAGEERKLAVTALHKERIDFEGKEEILRHEQEKLIMERDELREKVLEYQFLINQYSKQIQHDKDSLEEKICDRNDLMSQERHSQEIGKMTGDSNIDFLENYRPTVHLVDSDPEKMPTYYAVTEAPQCKAPQTMRSDQKTFNESIKQVGGSTKTANLENKVTHNLVESSLVDEDVAKAEEDKSSKVKFGSEKTDLDVQQTLIIQQTTLLEQQKQIQEQLEHLKMLQQKYSEEISQMALHNEKQLNVDNSKGEIENGKNIDNICDEMNSKDAAVGTDDYEIAERSNQPQVPSLTTDVKTVEKTSLIDQSSGDKVKLISKEPETDLHRYVMKEMVSSNSWTKADHLIENDSVYSAERKEESQFFPQETKKSKPQFETRKPHFKYPSQVVKSRNVSNVTLVDPSREPLLMKSVVRMDENFSNDSKNLNSRRATNQSTSSVDFESAVSRRRQMDSLDTFQSLKNSSRTSLKSRGAKSDIDRKQVSLLNVFTELDSDSSKYTAVGGDFELGSYLGFAEDILHGKSKNEQIFASTDYSDSDSEPDEMELLADVFYLNKF